MGSIDTDAWMRLKTVMNLELQFWVSV